VPNEWFCDWNVGVPLDVEPGNFESAQAIDHK